MCFYEGCRVIGREQTMLHHLIGQHELVIGVEFVEVNRPRGDFPTQRKNPYRESNEKN